MAVNVNHTRKIFGQGDTQISALNDISFSINTGEFVVIMGPSGAGKSTLIHILAGLEDPDSGTVAIDNLNLNNLSDTEKCDLRRNKIGLILQFFNLHPQLTVEENIELPLMIAGIPKSQRKDRIERTLLLVAIVSRRNHYPSELSGGEQQRVAIARALVINPKIILADEPTGELDTETGSEIINLLHELNKKEGVTVLQVTHDEAFLRLGDRLILMEDGKIIKDQLLEQKNQLFSPSLSIQTELG